VCSFSRDSELPIYYGNILLMDNKLRKMFVIKQSEGCRFMHKMHQNAFGGRVPPGPTWGSLYAAPDTPAAVGVSASRGREGERRSAGLLIREGRL